MSSDAEDSELQIADQTPSLVSPMMNSLKTHSIVHAVIDCFIHHHNSIMHCASSDYWAFNFCNEPWRNVCLKKGMKINTVGLHQFVMKCDYADDLKLNKWAVMGSTTHSFRSLRFYTAQLDFLIAFLYFSVAILYPSKHNRPPLEMDGGFFISLVQSLCWVQEKRS